MTGVRGMPPGRAGRIWLTRRLAVANRAADLLDRKVRALRQEVERFALLAERTGREWAAACAEADTWLLRAGLVGGQADLHRSAATEPAEVRLVWAVTMGVSFPGEASCTAAPFRGPTVVAPAVVAAIEAHGRALDAGVRHAAARAGLRAVTAELAATRSRLRAVNERWLPRINGALTELELALEEREREEGVNVRWALRAQGSPTRSR